MKNVQDSSKARKMIRELLIPICIFLWIGHQTGTCSAKLTDSAYCKYHHARRLLEQRGLQEVDRDAEREVAQLRLEAVERTSRAIDKDEAFQVANLAAKAAQLVTGIPFVQVVSIVESIVEVADGDKPSLWDQVENKVKLEIRAATSNLIGSEREDILCFFKYKMDDFATRGKNIMDNPKHTDEDIKHYIDTLKAHLDQTIRDIHKFDFAHYQASLVFDWALMDMYIQAITHQRSILALLVSVTKKLTKEQTDNDYKTSTYVAHFQNFAKEWANFATYKGPKALSGLYWNGTTCTEGDDYLSCTVLNEDRTLEVPHKFMSSARTSDMRFAAADLKDGLSMGCAHESGWRRCRKLIWDDDGDCVKDFVMDVRGRVSYEKRTCGGSARRFYLPVAEKIWSEFTLPVLKLVGAKSVESVDLRSGEKTTTASGKQCATGTICRNPDDHVLGPWCETDDGVREECFITELPKQFFSGDCVSPCGKWDGYAKWCAKKYSHLTPYGGTWDWC